MSNNDVLPFASLDRRPNRGRVFGIREHDLLRHLYLIGKFGSGKTLLLEHLPVATIPRGGGCAVLDPW